MKKINPDSPPPVPPTRPETGPNGTEPAVPSMDSGLDTLARATRWVQEHQTVALTGAFGLGVFIGVLLRSE